MNLPSHIAVLYWGTFRLFPICIHFLLFKEYYNRHLSHMCIFGYLWELLWGTNIEEGLLGSHDMHAYNSIDCQIVFKSSQNFVIATYGVLFVHSLLSFVLYSITFIHLRCTIQVFSIVAKLYNHHPNITLDSCDSVFIYKHT